MPLATGSQGHPLDTGIPVVVTYVYGDATPIDGAFFVADRAYKVLKVMLRSTIAGTDGGAVTGVVKKAPSATAIASGTAVHQSSFNLKTTADTSATAVVLSATDSDTILAAGDALGLDVTGTTTAARGCVTVILAPLA